MLSALKNQPSNGVPRKRTGEQVEKIRLLLIDSHPILRESFAFFISREADLEVCAQTGESCKALEQLSALNPQLVLLEIAMEGENGIGFIEKIHKQFPNVNILVFSHQDECIYAERALRAGAKGYIMKDALIEDVMGAIRKVGQGGRYLSRMMQERMLETFANGNRGSFLGMGNLSDRELAVFRRIGAGLSTREIAEELRISIKTVETYRAHIKKKLGLRNGTQLMQRALQNFSGNFKYAGEVADYKL
jgi:DNA-binding NarL/FixJ family response regulator